MEKEFKLSKFRYIDQNVWSYEEEQVKEFIKRLKLNINEYWTNGEGQCICPECWENRKSDEDRATDCMFLRMFKEIDKLAGKDLI